MARAALPGRLNWQLARVVDLVEETPRCTSLILEPPDWSGHRAGQHVDVRLTAEDGYQAQRSYSIASGPEDAELLLTIERLDDGEVSPYLVDELRPGDELELRGPIGGWFVWDGRTPAVGIAGGTGVVPLISMQRHAGRLGTENLLHLAVSSRTLAELPYADELAASHATIALSRERSGNGRAAGRLTAAEVAPYVDPASTYYICGSAGFAESASELLMSLGVPPGVVRVERFGPSG